MNRSHTPTNSEQDDRRFGRARWVLAVSMLVMGACGIIYEYTLGVLGNNLLGSSHEQIFIIIGLMMFSMGVGAAVQRKVQGDLLDKFLILELILGAIGGVSTILIYATFTVTASYQIVHYGIAFLIGAIIGMEIPLIIRINETYEKNLRINLANILAMDYVGALIGAILFAYILITQLSLSEISFALGLVNTSLALGGTLYFWPLLKRGRLILSSTLVTLALLAIGFHYSENWVAHLEQRCFRDPIVHRETSTYQHLLLTKRGDRVNFYINGRLQLSSVDEGIYHELLVHPNLIGALSRERVLILGGGDGMALREVLRYRDVKHVTLVDIDPQVVQMASEHPELVQMNLGAFDDARVVTVESSAVTPGGRISVRRPSKLSEVYLSDREYELAEVHVANMDADLFLREINDTYDCIIIDFPDPNSVELAKLYSVDFYRTLRQKLSPGGLISIQSTSPSRAKDVFLCIGETLKKAGLAAQPYHRYVPSFGEWGWYLAWNEDGLNRPLEKLMELETLPIELSYLTPETIQASFVFGKGAFVSKTRIDANTKMRPVVVDYYKKAWK